MSPTTLTHYQGGASESRMGSRLTLSNRQENLNLLLAFVQEWARGRGLSAKRRAPLENTAEEIFLRLIQAFPPDQPGSIAVTLEEKGARVRLMFEDDAPPYDPTCVNSAPAANTGDPPARVCYLSRLRQATDSLVFYRTADRKNRLVVFLSL
jgi:hypothetical protein